MSRIRSIKPQFFINDELAALGPLDRLLFIGLWTMGDREGRLEDRPVKIKAAILPYDSHDVEAALRRLAERGFIERYSVEGDARRYIQITNFGKHQCPNSKELPSAIPAPREHSAGTVPVPCQNSAGTMPEPCRHSSGTLRLGKGKERKGKGGSLQSPTPAVNKPFTRTDGPQKPDTTNKPALTTGANDGKARPARAGPRAVNSAGAARGKYDGIAENF